MGGFGDQDDTLDETVTRTFTLDEATLGRPTAARRAGLELPERYVDLGYLGSGSMGEVRRVRDVLLGTVVAMKVVRPEAHEVRAIQERFEAEARLTARLRHPNIVSIHDTGTLADGRIWFTMEVVEGRTLGDLIDEVHEARGVHTWRATTDGWTLRRLLQAVVSVCDAVGYAHSKGVVHRDLKPRNIMVGEHGEVKVMDWGIALGPGFDMAADPASVEALPSAHRTALGKVVGTPAYMSPEQAAGEREAIGPPSDVFALGMLLYHVVCGRPAFDGSPEAVVRRVRDDMPPPLSQRSRGPALPPGLEAVINEALRRDPAERPPDASVLAERLRGWLASDARRGSGLALVDEADTLLSELPRMQSEVQALRQAARSALAALDTWSPVVAKSPSWQLDALADEKEEALDARRSEIEELLWSALAVAPGLPEARERLADLQADALRRAEQVGRLDEAEEREMLLRDLDDGRHRGLLAGTGAVSLVTDPPGATVRLHRMVEQDRRLVPVFERDLGETPLDRVPVGRGSWMLEIVHEGHETVYYPVCLDREEHWDGVPPRGREPLAVPLPPAGTLGPGEVYVPPGWFRAGGDAPDALPASRIWVEGFIVEVTQATAVDWLAMLHALADEGHIDEARARARPTLYQVPFCDPTSLAPTVGEDLLHSVVRQVGRSDMRAWLRWRRRDGHPWRFPHELEWEKAARGVDGRRLPWGHRWEPHLAWVIGAQPDPVNVPVGHFAGDRSPYGVADLVGGVQDVTATGWSEVLPPGAQVLPPPRTDVPDGPLVLRGGRTTSHPPWNWTASRHRLPGSVRAEAGLRLVRSWPERPR